MFRQSVVVVVATMMSVASAYAAQAPTEEKEFPLTIVFALIAVACGVGTAIFASQKKKND